MKSAIRALAIVLALSTGAIAAQAQTNDDESRIDAVYRHDNTGYYNPAGNSGYYNQADPYTDPKGFPLPGWSQLKRPLD